MKNNLILPISIAIVVLIFSSVDAFASELTGNLHVDNSFEAYISTDDSVQGTLLSSGNDWRAMNTVVSSLNADREYYLHIKAKDVGGVAGFLGDFALTGTDHTFSNGLTTLTTNTDEWFVSKTGWSNYQVVSAYGANGVSPWGTRTAVSTNAQWIWSSNNDADNLNYFTTKIVLKNPAPLLKYSFEEASYNGSANEIIDSTANAHHARVIRNSSPANTSPAISSNPGTCRYVRQNDGSIQVSGLPLDTSTIGVKTTVTFWMNWDGTNSTMPVGWNMHDIWITGGSIGFNTGAGDVYGTSSAGLANGWHHIAVEFTNGSVTNNRMHIDGVEQVLTQRQGSPNNSNAFVDSELRIGGWSANSGYDFHGLIDELSVYQQALSTAQINTIMGEKHPCPSSPVADYRFDEISWNGTPNEVFDNSGNSHHGDAIGMSTLPAGKICAAGDFTATGTSDYLSLANTATNGLDDFSVSVWATTNGINTATILSGANAGQKNEMIMFFLGSSKFSPHIKGTKIDLSNGGIGDGNWHHLVWTRTGTKQCYYVDGALVECGNLSQSGVLNIAPGGLIIGQEQDSLAGNFDANQAWDGLLDELMIFDSALQASEINDIYTNQNLGKNYDGSIRTCPVPAIPLLEYRFEESTWNGTAGEVLDSTGNGYNAVVIRNSTPQTASPALPGNPGTCGYASQNSGSIAVNGLPLDTSTPGVKTTVTFWMHWDGSNGVMPLGWNFHDIYMVNGSIGFNTFMGDVYGFSSAGLANQWHHVAVEFTNGSVTNNRIHINGVEQVLTQRIASPNNARAFVNSQMRVGGVSNSTSYNFRGLLDEFRVYPNALTTAQIINIMEERHACTGIAPHHFEIVHDGQGLSCEAKTLTIKACNDASCSSLNTESITLDVLGNGAFISTQTFTGSTTLSFNHTDVETLTLSLANPSMNALNPLVCDDGSGNSCDIVFTDAGFRFLYAASNNTTVPDQIAGSVFGDSLQLQAVKSNDGVCEGLFNGNKNIELSQENIDPSISSGLSFSVSGNNIAKHPTTSDISLNFGANSIATIPAPIYHDAGRIRLHANYNFGGIAVSGSSNAFWVSPAELTLSASIGASPLNGDSATSATRHKAGENFTLSVSAINSLGIVTPNYSPGQIQLALMRTAPTLSGSVDGSLTYTNGSSLLSNLSPTFENVTLSDFIDGVSTFNAAQYSEVGLLNMDIQDSNFANAGIVVSGLAVNLGRFVPDHFKQTVVQDGLLHATCDSAISFIAYSGQKDQATGSKGAISYLTNPVLEITAYNKQGNITQNYFEDSQGSANDFMKLSATDIHLITPSFDEVATGIDTNKLPITADIHIGTISQNDLTALPNIVALPKGVVQYELSSNDNFFYARSANAKVRPFTSDIDFAVATIIDSDNVPATSTLSASPTGVEVHFGRLSLNNSFGPETANLAQAMQVESFNGSDFVRSSNDDCLAYDASNMSLSNISLAPSLTYILGTTGRFSAGQTKAIELKAPGAGNQGELGVVYEAYDWLKYDWNNDGVYSNPSATASFGLYRGDDKLFHWRENY